MQVFPFFSCWSVFPFRERNDFTRLSEKRIIVLYLQLFNTQKTPHCNRSSGIYILARLSEETSPGRQIFHQVASFCQVAVLPFSNIHKWCMLGMYKSHRGSHKLTGENYWRISPGTGEVKFPLGEGKKSTGSGFTGSFTEGFTKYYRFQNLSLGLLLKFS